MTDIRIDGQSVELTKGTTLVLERYNPMLDFAQFPGSKVFDFNLPETPKNRRILGFFNEAQVNYQNRRFYCEKYENSQLIERGFVKLKDSSTGSYNLFFTQNLGEAFGDLQNRPLTEIDFGSVPNPAAPTLDPDPLTADLAWPMIFNPAFYGNAGVGGFGGYMNRVDAGTGNMDAVGRVPMLFLSALMRKFGALTGWSFGGPFLQDPDIARLLLYNLYAVDGNPAVINFQNHLPEMTFPQVLVGLRQLFNLYVDFDVRRKVCSMDFGDPIFTAPTRLDWTAKADPEHTKVPELMNRLELAFQIDSNDALMKPIPADLDKYTTAETARTAGGSLVPIMSRFSTLDTDPAFGLARTSQPGISVNNKDNGNRGTPKMIFFNGVVGGKPVATNGSGNRRLAWHGANNLVDRHWVNFERFKANTFLIRKMVYLTPADLATYQFREKVHIRGVNYVVGSLKAVLGASEDIIPTELELWKA